MGNQKHDINALSWFLVLLTSVSLFLYGCQTPGENLQSNVYKAGQVNSVQEAKVIKILAVMPAKVEVDNSQQKKGAEVIGGILGAIGGGVVGHSVAGNSSGTTVGAVGGGVGGAVAGSLVSDKVLVDGVSITYKYKGKTLNSAQVGKVCEYKPGKALVISTSPTETRIQPNATCPSPTT
jgi:outer membrane lipoprotein SlyB